MRLLNNGRPRTQPGRADKPTGQRRRGRVRAWQIAACACFSVALAQCDSVTPPAQLPGEGDPEAQALFAIDGLTHYAENGCGNCHCNDGSGGCNVGAPRIAGQSLQALETALRPGTQHPPLFQDVSRQELGLLALYLRGLDSGLDRETLQSGVTRGFDVYLSAGCVECHLSSGQGSIQTGIGVPITRASPAALLAALIDPERACHPLRLDPSASPEECRALVSTNPGVAQLTDMPLPERDTELEDLAFFLNFIASHPNTGVEPCQNLPGEICTVAGTGETGFLRDHEAATSTWLYYPMEVTGGFWNDDDSLDLVIADWNNHRVRVIDLDENTLLDPGDPDTGRLNVIESAAGTGRVTGNGALFHPTDAAFDTDGNLITLSWHSQNIYLYRQGDPASVREQLAGSCELRCSDDAPTTAGATPLALPTSIAIHPDGRIFFSESGCSRIRVLDTRDSVPEITQAGLCDESLGYHSDATLTTLAGAVECQAGDCFPRNGYGGDGFEATEALFNVENGATLVNFGIALSPGASPQYLYIADSRNNVIRRVDLLDEPPTIQLFAGAPNQTGFMDGDAISEARFNFPTNVHVAPDGRVYVADSRNHAIRVIDPSSLQVTTVAGTGRAGFNGDNLAATDALLNLPGGMWVHPEDGRLFIADSLNSRVRVVCPSTGCPTP